MMAARTQINFLTRFLTDQDPGVRVEAVRGLAQYGIEAVPSLLDILTGADAAAAREAAATLGKIGPSAAAAVPALTAALQGTNLKMRLAAATALGCIGPASEPAIPALGKALQGSHLVLSRLAAQALSRIGRPAVPALVELLQHTDRFVRREAAWALGETGPNAVDLSDLPIGPVLDPGKEVETIPETRNAKTPVIPLRKEEVVAEWRPTPLRPAVVHTDPLSALNAALSDEDAKVRAAALQALDRIRGK